MQMVLQLWARPVRNVYFIHHADSANNGDPDTIYVSFLRTDNINLRATQALSNMSLVTQTVLLQIQLLLIMPH